MERRLKNVRLLVRPTMYEDTDASETVTGPQSFNSETVTGPQSFNSETVTGPKSFNLEMVTGPKSFNSELVEKEENSGGDVRRSTCLVERCGKSDGGDVREVEMNVVEIYRKRWR